MSALRAASLLALVATGCLARPQVPLSPPGPAARDPEVLPFEQPLDAELQRQDPALYARLQAMDQKGDRDGVFTRGDALAAGLPQLFGDLHAHPFMAYGAAPLLQGLPASPDRADSTEAVLHTQVTLDGLRRGATDLVFAFAYVPDGWAACAKGREGRLGEVLCQLRKAQRYCERHRDRMAVARSAAEARAIVRSRRVAVVLGLEGGDAIERVEDVDALFAAGVRVLTLTHFVTNPLAGAASSALLRFEDPNFLEPGERGPEGFPRGAAGLTPLGARVVRRMTELGMVIDLEHASDAAVRDVLEATRESGAPLVVSHTGARALHPSELNVSDETARAVAARGGVVGLIALRTLLSAEGLEECRAFGAHFRHLLAVAGPEHVALGTDFNGFSPRPAPCGGPRGFAATGLRNAGDLPGLLQSLADEGVPPRVLEGMGENLLRVLSLAEARAQRPGPGKVPERVREPVGAPSGGAKGSAPE